MAKRRVLIVDDDEFFIWFQRSFLERDQFEIDQAMTGPDALAKMRAQPPDLVLLDLYMPNMNGDEVLKQMRTDEKLAHVPVIMVSQESKPEMIHRCMQAGCDEYVTKPINIADLMSKASRLVQAQQRVTPRVPARLKVRYKHLDDFMGGTAHNISHSGIYVRTKQPVPVGTKVEIDLTPEQESPETPPVTVTGEVVRMENSEQTGDADEHGLGVRFVNLDADSRRLLASLVRHEKAKHMVDVLLVEDDRLPRELMRDTLVEAGYRVAAVWNGLDALKKLDVYQPRLVISDIVMPRVDGIEFAQAIRNNMTTREIPFIFASSKTDKDTIERAKKLGASYFIAKPVDPTVLMERVRKILPAPGAPTGGEETEE